MSKINLNMKSKPATASSLSLSSVIYLNGFITMINPFYDKIYKHNHNIKLKYKIFGNNKAHKLS